MALHPGKNIANGSDAVRQLPNFAIVHIPEGHDVLKLFNLLITNGFTEVSFVKEVRENAFLPVAAPPAVPEVRNPVQEVRETVLTRCPTPKPADDERSHSSPSISDSAITIQATSSAPIPSPIPFVARPRGARATTGDDPTLYAVCKLCQNKIMSSRLSNLTNHVRRHASLKQFQCVYCIYTHNEMAKVRLHMQHNHKDHHSQPMDALSPEMQSQWDALMEQCFPGYSTKVNAEAAVDGAKSTDQNGEPNTMTCRCGQSVSSDVLVEHIEKEHKDDCTPYACGDCGFLGAEEWKVRLHITLKHSEKAAEVAVKTLEQGSNLTVFLRKYFQDLPSDEEETKMLEQFQNLGNKDDRVASPVTSDCSRAPSVEGDTNGNIRCELCNRQMPGSRSLSSLMNHAKRHYHLKQYKCSECTYTSSEAAHVRTHMSNKHPTVLARPLDNNNAKLQNAWIETMRRCFPKLIGKIDQFRFKHSRGDDPKEGDAEDSPQGKSSRTKRKTVLRNHKSASPPEKISKLQNGNDRAESL